LARPEPPGRLHTSTGTPYEECRPLARRDARVGFPDRSGAFSVADWAAVSQIGRPVRSPAVRLSLAASGHRMSLATFLPPIAVADMTRRQAKVCLQPLIYQADQNPLGAISGPGTQDRRSPSSPERTFRWPGRGDAFLGSRQFPHHLILPHGHPRSVLGQMRCLLSDLRQRNLAAS